MSVSIKPVKSRRELRWFIKLPAEIHLGHAQWVPPLYALERRYFNPRINPSLKSHEINLLLAYRGNLVVGRLMLGIHHAYNSLCGEKNARFSSFECRNDPEAAEALLDHAEQWSRDRGMDKLVGPLGLSDTLPEPQGLLIEGYEFNPAILTNCNFPYLIEFLERAGYRKDVDYVAYKVPIPGELPEFYRKITQRVLRKKRYELLEFRRTRDLKAYAASVFNLMNESFRGFYGYMPHETGDIARIPGFAVRILAPRCVKLASHQGEIVGFILALPNMSTGIRRSKGRLLPLGILRMVRAAKRSPQLDLLFGAIKEGHRGRGVDVLMAAKLLEDAADSGFVFLDSHLELESNTRIRNEMEAMGGRVYKRFRVFQKMLH